MTEQQSTTHSATADNGNPIAKVKGQVLLNLPKDLYIPPDALEVILEAFEGPLDLLLYLIRRQNMDILDIPIAQVTQQYMGYIELMDMLRLELAAEYLVMAAILLEIKSRMLLPVPKALSVGEEIDPRVQLMQRLQEYERIKQAADQLAALPQEGRDIFQICVVSTSIDVPKPDPVVELRDLALALQAVLKRANLVVHHQVRRELLSVRERMSIILARVQAVPFVEFTSLFTVHEGRMGVVVTFSAVLELLKSRLIDVTQAEPFCPIHIRASGVSPLSVTTQEQTA